MTFAREVAFRVLRDSGRPGFAGWALLAIASGTSALPCQVSPIVSGHKCPSPSGSSRLSKTAEPSFRITIPDAVRRSSHAPISSEMKLVSGWVSRSDFHFSTGERPLPCCTTPSFTH